MRLLEFWLHHQSEFLSALLWHVVLTLSAATTAFLIGLPIGILAYWYPRIGAPFLAFANIVQPIPSLALFGFLISVPFLGGIGVKAALIALILYALLPIVSSTVSGLQNVESVYREAAMTIGATDLQILWWVELPMARAAILVGVRIATITSVGTATIAAAIGAGGLGEYIFRGVASVDSVVILAGTIPVALLALLANAVLSCLEHWLAADRPRPATRRRAWLGASGVLLGLGVIGGMLLWQRQQAPRGLVIGAKNFTEQVILGELLAQAIEQQTALPVTRKFNLGDTLICEEAMRAGQLDAYVEYTGTALTAIFKQPILQDQQEANRRIAAAYAATGRTMLAPLGFNNTFVILVRRADAERLQLQTISDVARYTRQWRAGVGAAFLDREDGYRGLVKTYGLQFAAPPRAMDLSLTYQALAGQQVDLIAGDATNGLIAKLDLQALADDRNYFPPYQAVPIVRNQTLERYPQIRPVLERLANTISDDEMRKMNYEADVKRRDPAIIVREFLARRRIGERQ
jgi:osmoprotectant transport system permease protein